MKSKTFRIAHWTAHLGAAAVAQSFALLYRRFSICRASVRQRAWTSSNPCRMQFGDAADYKSALRWIAAAALLLAAQSPALAHAFLDHADPKVGSTIADAPSEIRLWFTQDLEPAFSSLEVRNAAGTEVDKKDVHPDPKIKSKLIVSVPQLPAGTYTVSWRVISVDTHKTQGHFEFTVKATEK